jgi:hypothetical protein
MARPASAAPAQGSKAVAQTTIFDGVLSGTEPTVFSDGDIFL